MSVVGLNGVLQHLRRTCRVDEGTVLTDASLLEAYLLNRDEAAFAALVQRHGRMVLGVCQRLLRNLQDAEDAFQATFLVLARKAHTIVPRQRVGNWLYGVAYRTALKARGLALHRLQKEKAMAHPPEPAVLDPEACHDLRQWLDRELSTLPEIYRGPVVLCELDGQSKKEAAQQLGVPEGTVSSRLARGRELLRRRLARRGVPLTAVGLAAKLAEQATAAAPALVTTTVAAISTGTLSTRVALLAQEVMGLMLCSQLKLSVALLACCLVATGWWVAATPPEPAQARPLAATRPVQVQAPRDQRPEDEVPDLNRLWSRGKAEGTGRVQLTTFPIRLEELGHISPLGLMASGHVTPSDHLYVAPKKSALKKQRFDVVAVAAGRLVMIQWRPTPPGGQPDPTVFNRPVDLKLILEHSATCWSYLDHVTELDAALQKQVGRELKPGAPLHVRIPIKAGQVLGKVGYQTVDFGLIDTTVTLKGFVKPEQFRQRDQWKPHTVDPFDYVAEPLKSKLLAFNPRQVKPLGGKIDHDLDGRLVGSWYLEKTGGYAGLNRRLDYWVGHLAFAYHHVNPATIIISIGAVEGRPRQFQVRGNSPDPATISKADGIVKYALITPQIDNRTGKPYPDIEERYYGTFLAQVLDNRQLRVELVPGQTPDQVKGFSAGALLYER